MLFLFLFSPLNVNSSMLVWRYVLFTTVSLAPGI